ncbi:ThiF family adenylyltransferase [Methylomonas koyamae]|nr:ThiF family adenylyltransferase [Methylomonas koyamae]
MTAIAKRLEKLDMPIKFDYIKAFSRNIGWITTKEQACLREKKIAIAGLGGVGGSHLLTLTRLGVGSFHIADFDKFELANFNRQAGATISHLNKPKTDILEGMALDINPELKIKKFQQGINEENLQEFLKDVDVYVDALDFFAFDAREMVFAYCSTNNIPAITAAPLGMSTSLLNFIPGKMTFEEYFQLNGKSYTEKILYFLLGLSPAMLQRGYLVDPSAVDLVNHKGPSTSMACELCAGVVGTQVVKILLNRGPILAAPWGLQFDAYRNKLVKTWRPGGNKNPIQRLGITLAKKQFLKQKTAKE